MRTRLFKGYVKYVWSVVVLTIIAAVIAITNQPTKMVSPSLSWNGVVPQEIVYGNRTKKQVIFTFDAGDTAQSAQGILAALDKHHVKGTFFMTGKFIAANPALVKQIVAGDNEIFDHTYDHKDLTTLTDIQIKAELNGMNVLLASTTEMDAKPYFRAPYGARDLRVRTAAAVDGFQSVYWTLDARDWMESKGETADEVRERILSNLAPGTIVLMHVGDTITASILDDVFTKIEGQGYKIVSLTQGLAR
jgi:peptidoglycan/xylan/chitin deacetylase (PgdA/CDA1 family)